MNSMREQDRLNVLDTYRAVFTKPEEEFDRITELAASICGVPVAKINFVGKNTQWTKSAYGPSNDPDTIPREHSVCNYTIQQDTVLEIADLSEDPRSKDLPFVKNKPHYKYYLGTQLTNPNGHIIGALCVWDYEERRLTDDKKRKLRILADQVMKSLELRKQNQKLTKLNEQKTALMKILSHDLRSPLSGIIGMTDLLQELTSKENTDAQEMISLVNHSAKQVNQLINDILNYTLIDSEGFRLHPHRADINEVLQNMKRLYQPSARLKNITLSFDIDIHEEPIWIDQEKFGQIFGNLLSNAIKYTRTNGSVHSHIKLTGKGKNKELILKVSDTGIGMSKEFVDKLFTDESSRSEEGTSGEKSTGLGLSIIKHFTELHQGTINIDSTPNKGTTFTISLPVVKTTNNSDD